MACFSSRRENCPQKRPAWTCSLHENSSTSWSRGGFLHKLSIFKTQTLKSPSDPACLGCEVFICKHLCRLVKNLTVGQEISFPTPHTCEHHTPITNCLAAIIFLHPHLSLAGVSRNKSLRSETAWRDTLIRSEDLRFSYHNRPFTKPHLNALRQQSTHSRDDLETIWGRQLPVLFCVSILCFQ